MDHVSNRALKATKPALGERRLCDFERSNRSVADGDAGDVGALQGLAGGLGLVALKAGETGAEQFAVVLGNDRLGEGIGLAQEV